VQVAAVDHDVRSAVATLGVAQVELGQLLAVDRVAHDEPARGDAVLDHLVEQVPVTQDAGGVGRHLQACSDLAELGCLFQDAHGAAASDQRKGRAESADPTANHDGVHHVARRSGLGEVQGRFGHR